MAKEALTELKKDCKKDTNDRGLSIVEIGMFLMNNCTLSEMKSLKMHVVEMRTRTIK